jgi:hypothetical protein
MTWFNSADTHSADTTTTWDQQWERFTMTWLPTIKTRHNTIMIYIPEWPRFDWANLQWSQQTESQAELHPLFDKKTLLLLASTMYAVLLLVLHIAILSHPLIIGIFFIAALAGLAATWYAMT